MPADSVFISALVNELKEQLAGAKIDKIQQPERDEILLSLRAGFRNFRVMLSAGTGDARIHVTNAAYENPAQPPMFCMLLRKHLTSARILAVEQPHLERSVEITMETYGTFGDILEKKLILEMMGRYSNIILCDSDGIIIDCLRRIDSTMSEMRQILPGLAYVRPPQQDKADILEDRPVSGYGGGTLSDKWLLGHYRGISPLLCRELSFRAFGDSSVPARESDAPKLDAVLKGFREDVSGRNFKPVIIKTNGESSDYYCFPIKQYGSLASNTECSGFSELLDVYYTERDKKERMRQKTSVLNKTVRNARDRAGRKLAAQKTELLQTADRERSRQFGDIIKANIHAMKNGMSVLRAVDFYDENGGEVEIPLDVSKSPSQNAAAYYKEYSKAKNAEKYLTEQIEKGQAEYAYLESVLDELSRAESERDLSEIRRELEDAGIVKTRNAGKKGKPQKKTSGAPMEFTTPSGMRVRVGRNNVQNDELTHKLSYKTDMWFHVKGLHGSHAVLSTGGAKPDDGSVEFAASLAAYYSQGREDGKVAVDYTLIKNVKKPAGARAGMAIYTDQKTIIVEPRIPKRDELK